MSELAIQLIQENIDKHLRGEDSRVLDLKNCGMTEVPEEIGKCVWVEELDLSSGGGEHINKITCLPNGLALLKGLKKLWLKGDHDEESRITDLSLISGLSYLECLDCSYSKIRDLSPISDLLNLKQLSCSSTQVSDLSPISSLKNLQKLEIADSKILDLSPIFSLKKLKELLFARTKVSDLSPISSLKNLREIYLGGTLVTDLSPLSRLKNIRRLAFWNTKVNDISSLSSFKKLDWLYLQNSKVENLSPLKSLNELASLNCGALKISDWTFLKKLTKLKYLSVENTSFSDINLLVHLADLRHLDLSQTGILDAFLLTKFPKLLRVHLFGTQISDLSPFLPKIKKGVPVLWEKKDILLGKEPYILIKDCPIIIPPLEVAQESPQAVRDYFEELGENSKKLNEVKVIFIGESSAGKTSLVKRLLGENFDSKESQTHGIRIRNWHVPMAEGDTVRAHFWDFGGQEVMHATHQFFLSQRSIYVLLLNSRNDDQAGKWLKHAASFGGRSPVLVVLNKIDENPSFEVNRKTLLQKYPQIRDFFRLSAKTAYGLDEFREALLNEIDCSDTRCTPLPRHWLVVKEHFSNMKADYIESTEYRKVCKDNGVVRKFSQDVLLQFLHDLGVVINFRNLKNFDTQILNPLWLTNGVYRIINSEIVAESSGVLHEDDFDAVINDPRYHKKNTTERVLTYPKNKLRYIVRVMQEFELCFMLDPHTYIVPQLLQVQELEVKFEGPILRFVIHFPDFLPDSIFPRLMVKLHSFIEISQRAVGSHHLAIWRSGMVLHKPNIFKALARVRWDKEDQRILIDVCGEERRRFMSFIRETVKEIIYAFTNLNFNELVPIPGSREFLEYKGLVEAEKAGEKEIFVWQVKKKLSVAELLDGVEEPAMRDDLEQLPVRAFVSYVHKDLEYLKELRASLAPLIRLQKLQLWDDRDIEAGAEWEKVIFQQLEEADIILCLVSADFVASEFCYKREFGAVLDAHRNGEKTIVPVMMRKTDWSGLPLSEIKGTPGEWITSAANKDEAWAKVSESLRPALERAKKRKKSLLKKRLDM